MMRIHTKDHALVLLLESGGHPSISAHRCNSSERCILYTDEGMLLTLQHVIVEQSEWPEASAHNQHILLVQSLLWNLQNACTVIQRATLVAAWVTRTLNMVH